MRVLGGFRLGLGINDRELCVEQLHLHPTLQDMRIEAARRYRLSDDGSKEAEERIKVLLGFNVQPEDELHDWLNKNPVTGSCKDFVFRQLISQLSRLVHDQDRRQNHHTGGGGGGGAGSGPGNGGNDPKNKNPNYGDDKNDDNDDGGGGGGKPPGGAGNKVHGGGYVTSNVGSDAMLPDLTQSVETEVSRIQQLADRFQHVAIHQPPAVQKVPSKDEQPQETDTEIGELGSTANVAERHGQQDVGHRDMQDEMDKDPSPQEENTSLKDKQDVELQESVKEEQQDEEGGHGNATSIQVQADETVKDGRTALHRASREGDQAVVGVLLKGGASIDMKDKYGRTALHVASENGHQGVVDVLLKGGASIDMKEDKYGRTALQYASEYGRREVVDVLLKGGASIDMKDKDGWTALHRASENGHHEVVDVLLKGGASIDMKDNDGLTALHRASMRGDEAVVDVLSRAAGLSKR